MSFLICRNNFAEITASHSEAKIWKGLNNFTQESLCVMNWWISGVALICILIQRKFSPNSRGIRTPDSGGIQVLDQERWNCKSESSYVWPLSGASPADVQRETADCTGKAPQTFWSAPNHFYSLFFYLKQFFPNLCTPHLWKATRRFTKATLLIILRGSFLRRSSSRNF